MRIAKELTNHRKMSEIKMILLKGLRDGLTSPAHVFESRDEIEMRFSLQKKLPVHLRAANRVSLNFARQLNQLLAHGKNIN